MLLQRLFDLRNCRKWSLYFVICFSRPENVPRLFDLIRVNDERVKTAFYFSLGETLVAEDLDQAIRIGYGTYGKRHRVITLGGDLIDPQGIFFVSI